MRCWRYSVREAIVTTDTLITRDEIIEVAALFSILDDANVDTEFDGFKETGEALESYIKTHFPDLWDNDGDAAVDAFIEATYKQRYLALMERFKEALGVGQHQDA